MNPFSESTKRPEPKYSARGELQNWDEIERWCMYNDPLFARVYYSLGAWSYETEKLTRLVIALLDQRDSMRDRLIDLENARILCQPANAASATK